MTTVRVGWVGPLQPVSRSALAALTARKICSEDTHVEAYRDIPLSVKIRSSSAPAPPCAVQRTFRVDRPLRRARGTFAPLRRASDNPIAMACLRLVTRLPDRPDRSDPRLRSRMARATICDALRPYFGIRTLNLNLEP